MTKINNHHLIHEEKERKRVLNIMFELQLSSEDEICQKRLWGMIPEMWLRISKKNMDTNASKKYLESLENKASSVESVMKNLDIMNSCRRVEEGV